jgi:hypothetical protein
MSCALKLLCLLGQPNLLQHIPKENQKKKNQLFRLKTMTASRQRIVPTQPLPTTAKPNSQIRSRKFML